MKYNYLFQKIIQIIIICLPIIACTPNNSGENSGVNPVNQTTETVTVGSKGFTEQDILMELLAQQIENKTKLKVERRRFNSALVTHNAIASGKIDAYVEYTGTAHVAILKQPAITNPQVVYEQVKQIYAQKYQLEVLPGLGFENTFAMVIRGEDARKYNLKTISDIAKVASQWRPGFGYEFVERPDGFPGLVKTYNLNFSQPPKLMDLGLIYQALLQKEVDLVNGNSTDGQIARFDLVILTDDQKYFPPYEAVPIVRQETLKKYPQLKTALEQLSGKISAQQMQKLNYQVQGEKKDVKQVVRNFLNQKFSERMF